MCYKSKNFFDFYLKWNFWQYFFKLVILKNAVGIILRSFLIFVALMFSLSSVYASDYVSNKDFNDAIKSGNVEFVRENISKVENVNSDDCFLCTAIDKKQNEILDILFKKCDPNAPETTLLPLYCALVVKNNYAVDKLLEALCDYRW